MGHIFYQLARWLGLLSPAEYHYPAIDVQLPGDRHLHLVGSIHMGTIDMQPLPELLIKRLTQADALIVEADISGAEAPFGDAEDLPPLAERLTAQQYQQVESLCDELGTPVYSIDAMPCWHVALMLQAASQQQKKVIELEGAQEQLALLKQLPEDGRALLDDTLTHWHTNARLLQTMISWWLESQPSQPIEQLPNTFSNELYDVLMHQRNQRWKQQLNALPAGNYVVAVGALHLYGEGNLPDLLQEGKR